MVLSTVGVTVVPAMAYADSTCYTGCTVVTVPPSGGTHDGTVVPVSAPVSAPASSPAALPFTGADIEGMAAVGAGALLVGGALVRRSRRQRRATA